MVHGGSASNAMALRISKSKFKANMLEIFREIEQSGEELLVADHDRTVLRIQPFRKGLTVEQAFGDIQGKPKFYEDPNTPITDEWGELVRDSA